MAESVSGEAIGVGDLWTVVLSFAGSFAIAVLTVNLSLRRFYAERWWEKKVDAYSSAIEQLATLRYVFGRWYSDLTHEDELSLGEKKGLGQEYAEAIASVRQAEATGAYIISDDAITSLRNLLNQLLDARNEVYYDEQLGDSYDAVSKCLDELRDHARKDCSLVNVGGRWIWNR